MRLRLFALLLISMALVISCVPEVSPPPSGGVSPSPSPSGNSPTPTSSVPSASPSPTASSRPASGLPLNVTLHYLGVKSNHAESGLGDIYLLVVATDGYTKATSRFLPADGTFSLQDYETIEVDQRIFSTDSAGSSFKLCILAYQQNDPRWLASVLEPALAEIETGLGWGNYRSIQEILSTVERHQKESTTSFTNDGDSLIGYWEDVWADHQSLGIGQYEAVGSDDLRLWFSIWSKSEPAAPSQPALFPDVTLNNVDMVSSVSATQSRVDIISIWNRELHPLTVTLKGTSSAGGDFYDKTLEVRANGFALIESRAACDTPGAVDIRYDLYLRDIKIDSWSGVLAVNPGSEVTVRQWRSYDGARPVNTAIDGAPVTIYIEASGYNGKTVIANIRRVEPDGSYSYPIAMVEITVVMGQGVATWTAAWQSVAGGNPKYVFDVKDYFSGELTVLK